jgi:hypothetical protein
MFKKKKFFYKNNIKNLLNKSICFVHKNYFYFILKKKFNTNTKTG